MVAFNSSLALGSTTPALNTTSPINPPRQVEWYDNAFVLNIMHIIGPPLVAFTMYWFIQTCRHCWGGTAAARTPDTPNEEVEMDTAGSDGSSFNGGIDLEIGLGHLLALPRRAYHPRSRTRRVGGRTGTEGAPTASEGQVEEPINRGGVDAHQETSAHGDAQEEGEDERMEVEVALEGP